jgi:tRNA (guanine-N7-)-methyltransferase
VSKNKLSKFAEMKAFENVYEPELDSVLKNDFELKGEWNKKHFKNN